MMKEFETCSAIENIIWHTQNYGMMTTQKSEGTMFNSVKGYN